MISLVESQELWYVEEGFVGDWVDTHRKQIESRLTNLFQKSSRRMEQIKKELSRNGISLRKIEKYANRRAEVRNGRIAGFREKVNLFVRDLYARKFSDNEAVDTGLRIGLSVVLLAIVFFVNQLVETSCIGMGVPPKVATTITSIFCAPIVEETAKMISVQMDSTGTYFVIFNAAEFLWYLHNAILDGADLWVTALRRLATVVAHWIFTMVHVDAKSEGSPIGGLGVATVLHMLFNTINSFIRI